MTRNESRNSHSIEMQMDLPQVTNVRQLTTQDVSDICASIEGDSRSKYTDFDIICAGNNSQDHLVSQDFVIGDVVIEGIAYKFIHGFPGDEPNGVVYRSDYSVVVGVHWSQDKGDPITDWYLHSVNQFGDEGSDSEGEMNIPNAWLMSHLNDSSSE